MAMDDDRPAPPAGAHVVGEPLAALSIDELETRIVLLEAEILRLEAAIAAKRSTEDAANALFRR